MKFILGLPKDENEDLDSTWKEIEDGKNENNRIIIGIIIGFFLAIPIFEFFSFFYFNGTRELEFYIKGLIILMLIPVHEFLHLIFFPQFKNTIVGASLKHLIFYVSTKSQITKIRLLILLLFPFLILSIIPFILLFFYNNEILLYVFLYNTIGSGIDLISFYYILRLPNNILIKFVGKDVFYKNMLSV